MSFERVCGVDDVQVDSPLRVELADQVIAAVDPRTAHPLTQTPAAPAAEPTPAYEPQRPAFLRPPR